MKYVYGPVPSRRLGQSLGIDPIPLKTCNWNCVYCQLGRSRPVTNQRLDYFPPSEIIAEVQESLIDHKSEEIDWVTFVGSGEPALHSSLGWMIRRVKEFTSIPVAVITNGTFLYLKYHRQELSSANAVLPSLDAGNAQLYQKINRPHPDFPFKRHVEGLTSFRNMYYGKLWIEVMLIKGLNDSEKELMDIATILSHINPDEIHLNLPTRPPVESWVLPSEESALRLAKSIFGEVAKVVHPVEGLFNLDDAEDLIEAVVEIITRHPMSEAELINTLDNYVPDKVMESLEQLQFSGKAQVVERFGSRFWTAEPSYFPDKHHFHN